MTSMFSSATVLSTYCPYCGADVKKWGHDDNCRRPPAKIGIATVRATGETADVISTLENLPPEVTVVLHYDEMDYVVSRLPSKYWDISLYSDRS